MVKEQMYECNKCRILLRNNALQFDNDEYEYFIECPICKEREIFQEREVNEDNELLHKSLWEFTIKYIEVNEE